MRRILEGSLCWAVLAICTVGAARPIAAAHLLSEDAQAARAFQQAKGLERDGKWNQAIVLYRLAATRDPGNRKYQQALMSAQVSFFERLVQQADRSWPSHPSRTKSFLEDASALRLVEPQHEDEREAASVQARKLKNAFNTMRRLQEAVELKISQLSQQADAYRDRLMQGEAVDVTVFCQSNAELLEGLPELDELRAASRSQSLAAEGQHLLSEGDLEAAKQKFAQALKQLAGQAVAQSGWQGIQRREKAFRDSLSLAEESISQGDFSQAAEAYAKAREAHPQWFAEKGLEEALEDLRGRGPRLTDAPQDRADVRREVQPKPEATAETDEAADEPAENTKSTFADSPGSNSAGPPVGSTKRSGQASGSRDLLKKALIDLFAGELDRAISALENACQAGQGDDLEVRAWLAVGYASAAFLSPVGEAQERLLNQARFNFEAVLDKDPAYSLPAQVVSPTIRSLLEDLRSKPDQRTRPR